jgi:hypothetical protein
VTVPVGVSELTLGAEAIDFGNNVGVAPPVTVRAVPDPGTTATGRTLDEARRPIAGAAVACLGVSGATGEDGTFSIPGVPTIRGPVRCSGLAEDALGRPLTGAVTGGAPVRGGTTPVGDVTLTVRVAFRAAERFPGGTFPVRVQLADFNGDEAMDLVTTHTPGANTIASADALAVMPGSGDGTFPSRRMTVVAANATIADVGVGDLDGDGSVDAAVSHSGTTVSVLRGRGDGSFHAPQTLTTGNGGGGIAIGDLDGDPDVVRANRSASSVAVFLGNGDGTIGEPQTYATPASPDAVALADLDADGALDVVVATATTVALLMGNGDGTLEEARATSLGTTVADVAVADFDGDGAPDVVTANVSRDDVSLFLGNGDGTLGPERRFAMDGSFGVAVGDVNGDGFQDVATVGFSTHRVQVRLGDGDGTLRAAQSFPGPVDNVRDIQVGDLNGDGAPDVVVPGTNGSAVWVLLQER